MPRFRRKRNVDRWVDPVGWDPIARRCHDVTPTPGGLLHHSVCWCRSQ